MPIQMGWKHVPTAIEVDNSTAVVIATNEFYQNKSKVMDMRFYWINNRIKQGQFRVFWRSGLEKLGDYHYKHHTTEHHIAILPKYLHGPKQRLLRGCVNLTVTVSSTAQQIPTLNPTKQEILKAQLQHYFI